MSKQIIEISSDACTLSLYRGFLAIHNKNTGTCDEVPIDNILSLVISANDTNITKNIITALTNNNCNIIFCGKNYIPSSIVIPFLGHWLISERVKQQLSCSVPLRKNLWRFIVQSKIMNQALLLKTISPENENILRLEHLSKTTLSDDSRNNEGRAANIYFKSLFGERFIRDRNKQDINVLLNYTYTVLRAIVARAVAGNGLLPYFGLKHCQKSNTMPLVDDLIEPFRPVADFFVLNELATLSGDNKEITCTPDIKRRLASITTYPVIIPKGQATLTDAIYDFAGKLVDSFAYKEVKLYNPKLY